MEILIKQMNWGKIFFSMSSKLRLSELRNNYFKTKHDFLHRINRFLEVADFLDSYLYTPTIKHIVFLLILAVQRFLLIFLDLSLVLGGGGAPDVMCLPYRLKKKI